MKILCTSCQATIQAADIQLNTGWAKCAACNEVFQFNNQVPGFTVNAAETFPKERPPQARAVLDEEPNRLLIHLPRKGVRAGTKGVIFFAILWNGFLVFWMLGVLGAFEGFAGGPNWGMAAFSIPFWLVGIGLILGIIWDAHHTRTVCLTAEDMTTQLKCGLYRIDRTIERTKISLAQHYEPKVRSGDDAPRLPAFGIEVLYAGGSFAMPLDSLEEERWLLGKINSFLKTHPGYTDG